MFPWSSVIMVSNILTYHCIFIQCDINNILGEVDDDINFTYDADTVTWGSCTASLNNEMYVFGGQNKLHAADYTQYQVNFHKNDITEIELYLSWPR